MLLGNLEGSYTRLWVAPDGLKSNLLRCIEAERQKAKDGLGGRIIIKCNSLTDKELIEALAAASRDGVSVSLIIRGICCLIPQIPGMTENIRVISIVGRFLEHSRIYCFGNGAEQQLYISSADLMTRNTQRRVEVACPILDAKLRDHIYQTLDTMLMDNTQAWEQYSDGRYISRYRPSSDLIINAQKIFMEQARLHASREAAGKGRARTIERDSPFKRMGTAVKAIFRKWGL